NGSLAKFDGSNWSLFRPTGVDSRKSEWQQDFDKRLLIDKKGNIYQVFNKHILIFKTDSTWEDHPLDTDLKSAPYGQAGAIDLNGNIWFLTLKNNNVVFIRYNNNNWDIISTPIVSDTLGYQKLIFTLDSTMYLITTTGIHYNESSIWHTYNPNNSEVLSFSTTAAVDKKGNLWMRYSANYVAVFNPKGITELPQLTTVYDPEVYFDDNRVQILKVNSTQECLVVTVSDDTSKELDIYNLYGEQVLKTPIDGINNTNIDITHLMSGVYVGRIGDKSQLFILSK
ncbi:MAG: hypothetical protein JNJ85_14690, partial [Candidatus Kapabacteria bacterium]|nr:hypothetical protein [Candidatus Kapabacteria bacterium]